MYNILTYDSKRSHFLLPSLSLLLLSPLFSLLLLLPSCSFSLLTHRCSSPHSPPSFYLLLSPWSVFCHAFVLILTPNFNIFKCQFTNHKSPAIANPTNTPPAIKRYGRLITSLTFFAIVFSALVASVPVLIIVLALGGALARFAIAGFVIGKLAFKDIKIWIQNQVNCMTNRTPRGKKEGAGGEEQQ